MGTVSVLKMDIKGIGFPIPQEKREWICDNQFLYKISYKLGEE